MFNKKASLEISIQAIVIIVLAMTLLGLGLGFIKNMFGSITDLTRATFDKIADQLQRDLTATDQRLIFSQTKISLARAKSELYGWGIRNDGNSDIKYSAVFRPIKCPETVTPAACDNLLSDMNNKWFIFKYSPAGDPQYSVRAGEQAVERVVLNIPKDKVDTGLYLVSLEVKDDQDNQYANTDIFITVT